jgi:hypothetical protein
MTMPNSHLRILTIVMYGFLFGSAGNLAAAVAMQLGDGGVPPTTEPCECDWEKEIIAPTQSLPPCNSGTTIPTDPWSATWSTGDWSAAEGSLTGCNPTTTRARSHGSAALSVVCSTSGSGRTRVRVKHVGADCSCATVTAELNFTFSVIATYAPGGTGEARIKCNTGMWADTTAIQISGSREGSATSQSQVTISSYTFTISAGVGTFSGTPGSTAQTAGLQFNQSAAGIKIKTTSGLIETCHGLSEVAASVSACASTNPSGPGQAEAKISGWSGSLLAKGRCCCKTATASW